MNLTNTMIALERESDIQGLPFRTNRDARSPTAQLNHRLHVEQLWDEARTGRGPYAAQGADRG